jgi:hypothetical protein
MFAVCAWMQIAVMYMKTFFNSDWQRAIQCQKYRAEKEI